MTGYSERGSIIQLAQQCGAAEDPVLDRLVRGEFNWEQCPEWVKGTLNTAPDALSRNPTTDPQPQEMLAEHDANNNPMRPTIAEI